MRSKRKPDKLLPIRQVDPFLLCRLVRCVVQKSPIRTSDLEDEFDSVLTDLERPSFTSGSRFYHYTVTARCLGLLESDRKVYRPSRHGLQLADCRSGKQDMSAEERNYLRDSILRCNSMKWVASAFIDQELSNLRQLQKSGDVLKVAVDTRSKFVLTTLESQERLSLDDESMVNMGRWGALDFFDRLEIVTKGRFSPGEESGLTRLFTPEGGYVTASEFRVMLDKKLAKKRGDSRPVSLDFLMETFSLEFRIGVVRFRRLFAEVNASSPHHYVTMAAPEIIAESTDGFIIEDGIHQSHIMLRGE